MAETDHVDHGNSVAAWTGVSLLILGALFVGIGIFFASSLWWIIGIVVAAVGLVAGLALKAAGFGNQNREEQHDAVPTGATDPESAARG
ncbi:hypothetical protein G9U51_04170 [Calidifontibacter sp. DB0510]|uniref:Uncharacterized protein n=1 Tax=Metallococcus carri TaxID=1656884 RepID=A0A967AXT7_9MICO|nr:HGxxPAAW family protein [Metallococcus carri]NHN54981.1 hypothetical protein [Metallococcus carri]NOP37327.1 DUF3784 domain-containing protein [Calidifontibacter sp. DB2511S]